MHNERGAGRKRILTQEQEQEIYLLYCSKEKNVAELAVKYNLSVSTIARIIRRNKNAGIFL